MYTPISHIGKTLLNVNCFSSNSNRNINELIIDTFSKNYLEKFVNIKNNKLNFIIIKKNFF